MKFTAQDKYTPHWDTLIRQDRRRLRLSLRAYGEMFAVTPQAVAKWEKGEAQAPSIVTWMLYKQLLAKHEGRKREQRK